MPCYDSREGDEKEALKSRVNELARLLCEAMNLHEKHRNGALCQENEFIYEISPQLMGWWKEHRELDAKRLRCLDDITQLGPNELAALKRK